MNSMRKQFWVTKVTAKHVLNAGAMNLTAARIRNTYDHPYHTHTSAFFTLGSGEGGWQNLGNLIPCSRKSESKTRTNKSLKAVDCTIYFC